MRYYSPAKINLFLRVLGKRADGYHELASLFQAVSLFDTLDIELSVQDQFSCSDPTLAMDDHNSVIKAVQLFRQKTGYTSCLKIHLTKKIPVQSGLGGGSSNCATTLFALNTLFKTGISDKELAMWGAKIGADVAFFFSQGTAYCTGIGEKVHSLASIEWLLKEKIWIYKPLFGLSTPLIFSAFRKEESFQSDPGHLLDNFLKGQPLFENDLERVSLSLSDPLRKIKEKAAAEGITPFFMTGSGSAFCAIGNKAIPIEGILPIEVRSIRRQEGQWFCNENG